MRDKHAMNVDFESLNPLKHDVQQMKCLSSINVDTYATLFEDVTL